MTLKLNGSSSGSVSIDAPASTTSGADITFALPVADGTSGQALTTNGSGALSFATAGVTQTVGTWTPADGSGNGLTFSTAVGHYVKTGSLCTVFAHTVWPATSASGNVRFSGLPFSVKNVSDGNVCGGTGRARWGPVTTGYYPNAGGEGLVFGLANTTNVDLYYAFGTAAFPISVMGADQSGVDRAGNICTFELTYMVE